MRNTSLWHKHLLLLALSLTIGAPGCAWHRPAEKTLPPAVIHRDDVQFFPAGTEDTLYP